jgi:hypothetical protein
MEAMDTGRRKGWYAGAWSEIALVSRKSEVGIDWKQGIGFGLPEHPSHLLFDAIYSVEEVTPVNLEACVQHHFAVSGQQKMIA